MGNDKPKVPLERPGKKPLVVLEDKGKRLELLIASATKDAECLFESEFTAAAGNLRRLIAVVKKQKEWMDQVPVYSVNRQLIAAAEDQIYNLLEGQT